MQTFWYLIKIHGLSTHARYAPAQTHTVQRLFAAGHTRDCIAQQTGIPYSSLYSVAMMQHCSRCPILEHETGETP